MTATVDLKDIQQKLIQKLAPSGWSVKLKSYLHSSEFEKVLETLYQLKASGKRFTPPLKHVFSAFEECPLDQLKVVLIGQDPYPYLHVADGLAFSCSITGKPQPSLSKMFEALDLSRGQEYIPGQHDPSLKRWARQGVLLLNTALTCEVDKVGSHYAIWQDFLMYVLDMLSFTSSGLIFCLLGQKAQELEQYITPAHYVLKASHPASAAYSGGPWDCNDLFNEVNRIITRNNGPEMTIQW